MKRSASATYRAGDLARLDLPVDIVVGDLGQPYLCRIARHLERLVPRAAVHPVRDVCGSSGRRRVGSRHAPGMAQAAHSQTHPSQGSREPREPQPLSRGRCRWRALGNRKPRHAQSVVSAANRKVYAERVSVPTDLPPGA
jgi:hypothetical protein